MQQTILPRSLFLSLKKLILKVYIQVRIRLAEALHKAKARQIKLVIKV
jgi:hypothetical protein